MVARVTPTLKGADADRWHGIAKGSAALKEDCSKEYYEKGGAARDLYKKALEVAAEEAALNQGLENKAFAESEIEAWYAETSWI